MSEHTENTALFSQPPRVKEAVESLAKFFIFSWTCLPALPTASFPLEVAAKIKCCSWHLPIVGLSPPITKFDVKALTAPLYIYIWKNKNRISFFKKKEKKRHHLLWLGKSVSHKGSMSNRLFWEIFIYCALFVGSTFDHNQVQDKSIRNRADDGSLSPVLYSASGRWNEQPCSFSMYCSNALRLVCRGEHPAHILYYLLKNFLPCLSCKETS